MPPTTKRQEPPRAPTAFPPGSILEQVVPVTSLRRGWAKLCIYGRNRSGKTTLAAEFRERGPVLFISAEQDANGGADSIANLEGVHLIRIRPHPIVLPDGTTERIYGSAKVVAIAAELAQRNPFTTVVFDTATSLQDVILVELMKLPKVPDMLGWGTVPDGVYLQRAEKLRETLRPLLDLQNCNLVILAQEKDHNASEDRGGKNKILHTMQQGSFMAPSLGATNAEWLQSACGYVVQLYEDEVTQEVVVPMMDAHGQPAEPVVTRVGTGKRQRHLRLLYHPNFAAGGRWQFDRNTPEFVTAPTPRELYRALAAFIPALGS